MREPRRRTLQPPSAAAAEKDHMSASALSKARTAKGNALRGARSDAQGYHSPPYGPSHRLGAISGRPPGTLVLGNIQTSSLLRHPFQDSEINPLLAGLMWIGAKDGSYSLRHTCEEGDRLSRYGWLRHDGATYGRQELLDQGLLVSTSFLKSKDRGSGYGGEWAVRIRAEDATESNYTGEDRMPQSRLGSVFFYMAAQEGLSLRLWPEGANKEDGPFAGGVADEIGKWEIYAKYKDGLTMNYVGFRHLEIHGMAQHLWSLLETQARTKRVIQLPDNAEANSNVVVIQLTGTLPFEVDIVFVSGVEKQSSQVKTPEITLSNR